MHELSLCRSLLNILTVHSAKLGFKHIKGIYLEIGMLAMVEKSALQFNFDILKKHTIAEQAFLIFIDIPGEAFCNFCQKKVKLTQYHEACPNCDQFSLTITRGLELRVKSLEVK